MMLDFTNMCAKSQTKRIKPNILEPIHTAYYTHCIKNPAYLLSSIIMRPSPGQTYPTHEYILN